MPDGVRRLIDPSTVGAMATRPAHLTLASAPDTSLPIRTRSELRDAGATDHQITGGLRSGRLIALRRGVLALPGLHPLDAEAAAVVRAVHRDVVVSHAHAGRLWGLPEPLGGWPPLALTTTTGPTRRRDGLHILVAPCPEDEISMSPLVWWGLG